MSASCGLSIEDTHSLLFTVAADFGDIHGMAQYGEGMKLTGTLGSQPPCGMIAADFKHNLAFKSCAQSLWNIGRRNNP
jgi:hypothetical protein